MKERTALGEAILKHWREHCPAMVKDLERTKRLNRAVFEAQERAGELLHELTVVRKMNYQAAWEMAAQEWALPPEETETKRGISSAGRKTGPAKPHYRKSRQPRTRQKPHARRGTSG